MTRESGERSGRDGVCAQGTHTAQAGLVARVLTRSSSTVAFRSILSASFVFVPSIHSVTLKPSSPSFATASCGPDSPDTLFPSSFESADTCASGERIDPGEARASRRTPQAVGTRAIAAVPPDKPARSGRGHRPAARAAVGLSEALGRLGWLAVQHAT